MLKFNPLYLLILISIFQSCQKNPAIQNDFEINIRIVNDPANLNPIVGGLTTEASQVLNLIYLPLANYDPVSYELTPVLAKELNPAIPIEEGPLKGGIRFDFEILDEAVWTDGTPVTAEDYLFTLKAAIHPEVNAPAWRGLLNNISSVEIDQTNPKKFKVYIGSYFHLAKEASSTFEIFPKHIYDPKDILDTYALEDLKDAGKFAELAEKDSLLSVFAKDFNSTKYTQQIISGAGPYEISAWEIDQYISLKKKENYWGEKIDRIFMKNNPSSINFRVIADENTAITLLKDGSLDLMSVRNAANFQNLINSENFEEQFSIHTPSMQRFYFIGLNNRKPELADKDIRRALAHLLDVDNIIETLENGYGNRQIGTIMPNSPFFNRSLSPIPFDPEKSKAILEEEGWEDTNSNGTRDKIIDGELIELEIDYLASQSPLGQKVGLLLQDAAKEVGVKINMIIKEGRNLNQAVRMHDFEASASAIGLSLAPYDPYQRWHSDNALVQKANVFGYINDKNDELIERIRNTEDEDDRKRAYNEFQELMYDEQPVIFLYSPTQKFILNKNFQGLFTEQRPGYIVNVFELN